MDWAPLQSQLKTNFILSLIYFTIFFYDYVLTFGSEIRYFWPPRNPLTWPSFLFFLNRYLSLLGNILFAIEDFMNPVNFDLCRKLQKVNQPYVSATQFVVCVLCIFRVSAMYNHHRAVLSTLISYGCLMLAIAMWIVISGSEGFRLPPMLMDPGVPGCNTMVTEAQAKQYLVPWALVLGFDALVFGLTLVKASKIGWESPTHLANVLARDGTMYFIVIFLANLSNVLMYIKAPALLKATNTVLVNVLSATLMSRLMINLRAVNEHKSRRTWDDSIPLRILETRSCHDAPSSSEVLPLV